MSLKAVKDWILETAKTQGAGTVGFMSAIKETLLTPNHVPGLGSRADRVKLLDLDARISLANTLEESPAGQQAEIGAALAADQSQKVRLILAFNINNLDPNARCAVGKELAQSSDPTTISYLMYYADNIPQPQRDDVAMDVWRNFEQNAIENHPTDTQYPWVSIATLFTQGLKNCSHGVLAEVIDALTYSGYEDPKSYAPTDAAGKRHNLLENLARILSETHDMNGEIPEGERLERFQNVYSHFPDEFKFEIADKVWRDSWGKSEGTVNSIEQYIMQQLPRESEGLQSRLGELAVDRLCHNPLLAPELMAVLPKLSTSAKSAVKSAMANGGPSWHRETMETSGLNALVKQLCP